MNYKKIYYTENMNISDFHNQVSGLLEEGWILDYIDEDTNSYVFKKQLGINHVQYFIDQD